jgi:hypothetical protein
MNSLEKKFNFFKKWDEEECVEMLECLSNEVKVKALIETIKKQEEAFFQCMCGKSGKKCFHFTSTEEIPLVIKALQERLEVM